MTRTLLNRSTLDCDIPIVIATGECGQRLWIKHNPVRGTIKYVVTMGGVTVCSAWDYEDARNDFNDIGRTK